MNIRDILFKLKEKGREIIRYEEIKRDYEPTRITYRNKDKIVLFTVEGSDVECYSNLYSSRRDIYDVIGLDNDIDIYEKLLKAMNNPAPLETVSFNEYYKPADIGLDDLPFIKYYREDGGYYLTSSIYLSCYGKICNASYHRTMLINSEEATLRIVPRHLDYIVRKHFEHGEEAPVALILGTDPYVELASAMTPPLGVYEIGVAAALSGDDRVAKTPIHGIPVPVSASIVLEGVITREEAWEGPFVDILRLPDKRRKQPVFRLQAAYISRLYSPIYHAIVPGLWEHVYLMGFPREPLIYDSARKASPGVKSVRLTFGSGGWLHAVVSISKTKPGEARNVGLAVINGHPSVKHVVIVDDDINIDDPYMVEWAIATRVKGGEDIIVLRNMRGSTLDPRGKDGVGDKVVIDATKPYDEPWEKYRYAGIP